MTSLRNTAGDAIRKVAELIDGRTAILLTKSQLRRPSHRGVVTLNEMRRIAGYAPCRGPHPTRVRGSHD